MTPKKSNENVMSVKYHKIAIFLIYSQIGAMQKPNPGFMVLLSNNRGLNINFSA